MSFRATEVFRFESNVTIASKDVYVMSVPRGIDSKEELLKNLANGLAIPHFGANWDALEDSLRDLSWISAQTILIVHEELPELPATDLRNYLEILVSAAATWRRHAEEHTLLAAFPAAARETVLGIVGNYRQGD